MNWYYSVGSIVVILQILWLWLLVHNYRYALAKYRKKRGAYMPHVALIVPCKDLDADFDKNIESLFNQDYDNYSLWFVVEASDDPAYAALRRLNERIGHASRAADAQVLVSGKAQSCSQKVHNLLYAYSRLPADVEVMAFADSDACVRPDWLRHLVHPLRYDKNGATTGYRWFVPKTNNLATLALSAINAKIAQLLGNTLFNHAWGGSMAIRVQMFRQLGLDKIWPKALSDDLSLSCAVKDARKKVEFVPACLVATYESVTWPKLLEFGRRQFVITRFFAPQTWTFGLVSSLYAVVALWGTIAMAVYAGAAGLAHSWFYIAVPAIVFAGQLAGAGLRQAMTRKLLEKDWPNLRLACLADIALFWLWSLILAAVIVSSAFGRTIRWRGIKYKLISRTETVVLGQEG